MTKQIKAPPKTAGDILAMLKILKNPGTTGYASQMASLLKFLNLTSDIRTGAEIMETGLNISESGSIVSYKEMRRDFIDRKVSLLSFLETEENELESKKRSIWKEESECNKLLRSKAKTVTDKNREEATARLTELEMSGNEVSHELAKLRGRIKSMVDAEVVKLEAAEYSIKEMRHDQELLDGVRVKVTLQTGSYTFPVITGNQFHREVFNTIGLPLADVVTKKPVVKRMFQLPAAALQSLKKAVKFVSTDDLRPAMTHVLVEIREGKMQVVATDAHRLYLSQVFEVSGPKGNYEYLLPAKLLSRLPKATKEEFTLYELKDGTAALFGLEMPLLDARFPDYRVVMPTYEHGVTFDRVTMIGKVKQTLPYANKSTGQVTLHINGQIDFGAQDVDFSFQSENKMAYKTKSMDDLTIAFNGKFLIAALSVFNTEDITLQAVTATKAGIITDGTETVLIMPLMSNY